jgi:hypothetical protein
VIRFFMVFCCVFLASYLLKPLIEHLILCITYAYLSYRCDRLTKERDRLMRIYRNKIMRRSERDS